VTAIFAGLVLAIASLTSQAGPAAADAADPTLDFGWTWPQDYVGTYRFDAGYPTASCMRSAASTAVNTISHSPYRNPDFNLTTSTSANVHLQFLSSASYSCAGYGYYWVGCAVTSLYSPFTTWWVRLASNYCWTNGAGGRTCGSDSGAYDVQTVTLNEMGHVSFLDHHVNPDYGDAVVQAYPVAYPNTYWSMRYLRWADNTTLNALYGVDECHTPPCPEGADS
jgi:hypothetical protein